MIQSRCCKNIIYPLSCRPIPWVPSSVETASNKWRTQPISELQPVPAETITVGHQMAPVDKKKKIKRLYRIF